MNACGAGYLHSWIVRDDDVVDGLDRLRVGLHPANLERERKKKGMKSREDTFFFCTHLQKKKKEICLIKFRQAER